jgi:pimeloyl-ACP methyl ester carboxylesterase
MATLETLRTLLHPGDESADYGARSRSEWLDIDWSEHRKRISVRGREIEYVDFGEGDEVMLFIHGLGAAWQTWLENLPFFARTHRVIAPDLPGFGRSEMPDEEISIELYGEIMHDFCEELGLSGVTVVGNSMGGFIGAELAIKAPDRVERLVVVSAAVFWQEYRRAKPLMSLAKLTEASVGGLVAAGQGRAARGRPRLRALLLGFGGMRYPHLLPRELQVELLRTCRRTQGFVPALHGLGTYPLREELPRISCPTLIIWGTDDPLVSVRHGHDMADLVPNARKVIYERTGHVAMLERPDRFNRDVAEFMAESPGRTPADEEAVRASRDRASA